MQMKTLNDIYANTCRLARPVALKSKKDGRWVDVSVREFCDSVRFFSNGLRVLGVKPGDRVAILAENRPEWAIADFAILAAGAVTGPLMMRWSITYHSRASRGVRSGKARRSSPASSLRRRWASSSS